MMAIPVNCKRLVEVDFPIVAVSASSAKEKDIKTGSFAAVHVWWARRPLAACRAMNLACMIPDPADGNCPTELRRIIATALDELERSPYAGQEKLQISKRTWGIDDDGDLSESRNRPKSLRRRLLKFIGMYSRWDLKMSEPHTKCARSIITGCHDGNPHLLDSFAGGGSIPIEGLRIGMKPYATDINPIPILINKLQLQYLPRKPKDIWSIVEKEGKRINLILENELTDYYPHSHHKENGEVPVAYICARTVTCEGINCGLDFPMLSSPWLARSKKYKISYSHKLEEGKIVTKLIHNPLPNEVSIQTNHKGKAQCPICKHITPSKSVKVQMNRKQGGSRDSILLAVITKPINGKGRIFHLPTQIEIDSRNRAAIKLEEMIDADDQFLPTEKMPPAGSLGMAIQGYGMERWTDISTPRHLLTSTILANEISKITDPIVKLILGFAASKFNDRNSTLSVYQASAVFFVNAFGSHRIPMSWDFYEPRPFGNAGPNFLLTLKNTIYGINSAMIPQSEILGKSMYADATQHPLPDLCIDLWATDPPYYDYVPYSDISNYFVIWLKRMFPEIVLENGIAPKSKELVMDKSSIGEISKDGDWYEENISKALSEGYRMIKPEGIAYWVYAHKSTEGWSKVLKSIIKSGWMVTGSWPISTERKKKIASRNRAALKTSIHIVMRPRPDDVGVGEWSDILNDLPKKLGAWLSRMDASGVMGADAIYSCIGPAMELFSKYHSVERASGEEVGIDEYLQNVWDTVADEAIKILNPNSEQSTTEPDARFSMMAIWTLRQSANVESASRKTLDGDEIEVSAEPLKLTIPFDTASLLARGIGAVIDDLEKSEVIENKGGNVKILSPEDRRHYLLGVTSGESKVQQKASSSIQMKLGENSKEAEARVDVETKQQGLIEMPKRDSQLDKLHQAMLLHADGNSVALEAHLRDNIGDNPATWQLANTLNTLYAEGSWERSKIEGVIARHQSLR